MNLPTLFKIFILIFCMQHVVRSPGGSTNSKGSTKQTTVTSNNVFEKIGGFVNFDIANQIGKFQGLFNQKDEMFGGDFMSDDTAFEKKVQANKLGYNRDVQFEQGTTIQSKNVEIIKNGGQVIQKRRVVVNGVVQEDTEIINGKPTNFDDQLNYKRRNIFGDDARNPVQAKVEPIGRANDVKAPATGGITLMVDGERKVFKTREEYNQFMDERDKQRQAKNPIQPKAVSPKSKHTLLSLDGKTYEFDTIEEMNEFRKNGVLAKGAGRQADNQKFEDEVKKKNDELLKRRKEELDRIEAEKAKRELEKKEREQRELAEQRRLQAEIERKKREQLEKENQKKELERQAALKAKQLQEERDRQAELQKKKIQEEQDKAKRQKLLEEEQKKKRENEDRIRREEEELRRKKRLADEEQRIKQREAEEAERKLKEMELKKKREKELEELAKKRKLEEENEFKRKQEELKWKKEAEEEKRRQELAKAEEKRKQDLIKAEEDRKRQELQRAEDEKRRQEIQRAEESKRAALIKAEEERKKQEALRAEEERKRQEALRAEEERKRQEEKAKNALLQEQQRKIEDNGVRRPVLRTPVKEEQVFKKPEIAVEELKPAIKQENILNIIDKKVDKFKLPADFGILNNDYNPNKNGQNAKKLNAGKVATDNNQLLNEDETTPIIIRWELGPVKKYLYSIGEKDRYDFLLTLIEKATAILRMYIRVPKTESLKTYLAFKGKCPQFKVAQEKLYKAHVIMISKIFVPEKTEESVIARASMCDNDANKRTLHGMMEMNIKKMINKDATQVSVSDYLNTIVHETLHALGFFPDTDKMWDAGNKARVGENLKMIKRVNPKIYNNGHWDPIYIPNDLMGPTSNAGDILTVYTLEMLEFYSNSYYGNRNNLVQNVFFDHVKTIESYFNYKCSPNLEKSDYKFFCSQQQMISKYTSCSIDYTFMTQCSTNQLSNGCHRMVNKDKYNCMETNVDNVKDHMKYEWRGLDARCFESNKQRPLCLKYQIEENTVKVVLGKNSYVCANDGELIKGKYVPTDKSIPAGTGIYNVDFKCPANIKEFIKYSQLTSCPRFCNHNGYCSAGRCICYDGWDSRDYCKSRLTEVSSDPIYSENTDIVTE